MATILVIVLLSLATITISGIVLWVRYQNWPPASWRNQLLAHRAGLRLRIRDLEADDTDKLISSTWDRYFQMSLERVSVDRLIAFPGIGPVTIDRLGMSGLRTLFDLRNARFDAIYGIGPVRARDLERAVQSLIADTKSQFDSGASVEGQECRQQIARIRESAAQRKLARRELKVRTQQALQVTEQWLSASEQVTFSNYLAGRELPRGIGDLMARSMPKAEDFPPKTLPIAKPADHSVTSRQTERATSARNNASEVSSRPKPKNVAVSPSEPSYQSSDAQAAPPRKVMGHSPNHSPHLSRMRAIIFLAFVMANADGTIDEAEVRKIRECLLDRFSHDPELLRHIDPLMEQAARSTFNVDKIIRVMATGMSLEEKTSVYLLAKEIGDVWGNRHQNVQAILKRVAGEFGITPTEHTVSEERPEKPDGTLIKNIPGPTNGEASAWEPLERRDFKTGPNQERRLSNKGVLVEPRDPPLPHRREIRENSDLDEVFNGTPDAPPPPPSELRKNEDLDRVFGIS